MRVIDRPSPNFTRRRGTDAPDMIVLHYTGMETAEAAAARLCDPVAEVSAHWLVAPDGGVYALVDEAMRAWHAGAAGWGAVRDVNSHSIGIEIANPGHHLGYPPYPEPQMRAVERLVQAAMERWRIAPERVVGHACVSPGRKIDPGEKFDWRRLALQGLAVWHDPAPVGGGRADPARFRAAAAAFGYPVGDGSGDGDGDGEGDGWDATLRAVWNSFAMRFLPARTGSPPDAAGVAHIEALASRWPCRPAVA